MPHKLEFIAECDSEGRLPDYRQKQIDAYLKRLYPHRQVSVRYGEPTRTSRANAFYWGVVLDLIRKAMNEAGYAFLLVRGETQPITSEALHAHFKARYLPVQTAVIFGRDATLEPTTTILDKTQFFDYVEAIKNDEDVLLLGIDFPEPDTEFRSFSIGEINPY